MSSPLYKNIIVKIGTNVITTEKGLLDIAVMKELVKQVNELMKQGVKVTLVSSGAMGAGRSIVTPKEKMGRVAIRQVLASVGQIKLIHTYAELFGKSKNICAQVLATKEDFRDREHYLNMRKCLEALLGEGIVPIINENDVVSVTELMFTDNDELAGLIASMLNADAVFLLTSVEGVYTGDPHDPTSTVIEEINTESSEWKKYLSSETSPFGRGGMHTKCKTAETLAALGIPTHIASGRRKNVLLDILSNKKIGTVFHGKKQASSVKRWVAGSEGREKGSVTINKGAADILLDPAKAVSLLPIGIVGADGDFAKGDLIKIKNEDGKGLGLGIARYGTEETKEWMGKKGGKPLVHYDYLFLFSA